VPGPAPQGAPANLQERTWEKMDISCLVIKQGNRNILVDTGCGKAFQESSGQLARNLQEEGIKPADIDTIIYTHGHSDHVGGTFDSADKPVFSKARQVVSKREWDSWANATGATRNYRMFDLAIKNLLPIPGQFDLAEDNEEVIPGIKLVPAPGHTEGSVTIEIASGKDKLLCIGDLIHSQLEFTRPDYYAFLDSLPDAAIKQRTEGLREIAKAGTLVFACHFPFPGVGRFVVKEDLLSWQAIH
jgi:glyoxylase-like metal-dependent hydrolase (beta-lactamase superfamily II)